MKKDFEKTSKHIPEAPTVTDSDDLESQLGPGGDVAESLFRFFWTRVALGVPSGADPAAGIPGPALGFPTLQMGFPTLPQMGPDLKPKVIFQVSFFDDFG